LELQAHYLVVFLDFGLTCFGCLLAFKLLKYGLVGCFYLLLRSVQVQITGSESLGGPREPHSNGAKQVCCTSVITLLIIRHTGVFTRVGRITEVKSYSSLAPTCPAPWKGAGGQPSLWEQGWKHSCTYQEAQHSFGSLAFHTGLAAVFLGEGKGV
jgi:hypothetical protein